MDEYLESKMALRIHDRQIENDGLRGIIGPLGPMASLTRDFLRRIDDHGQTIFHRIANNYHLDQIGNYYIREWRRLGLSESELIQFLVRPDANGNTAIALMAYSQFMSSFRSKNDEFLSQLLQMLEDVEILDRPNLHGQTPLWAALAGYFFERPVRLMVALGARLNTVNEFPAYKQEFYHTCVEDLAYAREIRHKFYFESDLISRLLPWI